MQKATVDVLNRNDGKTGINLPLLIDFSGKHTLFRVCNNYTKLLTQIATLFLYAFARLKRIKFLGYNVVLCLI